MTNTIMLCILVFLWGCQSQVSLDRQNAQTNPPAIKTEAAIKQQKDPMPKQFTHTVIKETPYYVQGPQQGTPPNGYFKVGTKLTVYASSIGGYLLVESTDGNKGYVTASDVEIIKSPDDA